MKKLLFYIITLGMAITGFSEDKDEAKTFEETKAIVNKAKDRLVIDLSVDMLFNKPDSLKVKVFSRGLNAYFMYDVVIAKSHFSFAPGLGIGTNNYYINSSIVSDTNKTYTIPINKDIYDYKKNKISVAYVDIPVELRFRSKPNEKGTSWKLGAGFKAGINISNKWKYKGADLSADPTDVNKDDVKWKQFNLDNIQKFRYGVTLRGGYGMVNAFVYYSLSDLFKSGSVRLTPFSFGIQINGL
jgi:hypothetical protein